MGDFDEKIQLEQKHFLSHDKKNTKVDIISSKHKDEADGARVEAVRGSPRLQKFRHIFQTPYLRLFVSYFVVACNFLIYAEDPVAHSFGPCDIPVIGNAFSMIFTKYPSNGFSALKFFMWFIAVIIGIVIGKLVIHRFLLRKKLHVAMFSRDQGSWMICFFTTILVVLVASAIYNLFLSLDSSMTKYQINGYIGATNHIFMRSAALGTWFGDFMTAWMVTDMMLQDKKTYPKWLPRARNWWSVGKRRIILFWVFTIGLTAIVIAAVCSHFINWDTFNRDMFYTNELGRAFLASFILVMDFIIVMQDWDFPKFESELDIKLPGLDTSHIKFDIPEWLKKTSIHITGKWFQYGILFCVLILDLNMWKNQIFYEPLAYAQYVGEGGHIFSISDKFSLDFYGNKTVFSYDWRNSTIDPLTNVTYIKGDYRTNSRYRGYALSAKGCAFIPSIFVFILFGLLIHFFGKVSEGVPGVSSNEVGQGVSLTNLKSIQSTKRAASEEEDIVEEEEDVRPDGGRAAGEEHPALPNSPEEGYVGTEQLQNPVA